MPTIEHHPHYVPALTDQEAQVVLGCLLACVAGTDAADEDTWHGGLGSDMCEGCTALVKVRPLAGVEARDHLRP